MHFRRRRPRKALENTWTSPTDKSPLPDPPTWPGSERIDWPGDQPYGGHLLQKRKPANERKRPFEVWTRYTGQLWTPRHRGTWYRAARLRTRAAAEEWILQQQRKWPGVFRGRAWPYDAEIREVS